MGYVPHSPVDLTANLVRVHDRLDREQRPTGGGSGYARHVQAAGHSVRPQTDGRAAGGLHLPWGLAGAEVCCRR